MRLIAGLVFGVAIARTSFWGWRIGRSLDDTFGVLLGLGASASVLILAVQLLSLGRMLTPPALALVVAGFALALELALRGRSRQFPASENIEPGLLDSVRGHRVVSYVALYQMLVFAALLMLGLWIQPFGDNYHFSRPLYWLQNRGILPFPVSNHRITAFAPGGDILTLPFVIYLRWHSASVVLGALCVAAVPWVVWSLARRLGFAPLPSMVSAVASLGVSAFPKAIFSGDSDRMVPALLIGASLIALLEAIARVERGHAWLLPAAGSMYLFALGAGIKDVNILFVPGYLIFFVVCLGRRIVCRPAAMALIVAVGLAGIVASGAAWKLVTNHVYYGGLSGPSSVTSSSVAVPSLSDAWTRVLRGTTHFGDLTVPMPGVAGRLQGAANKRFLRLLGARERLAGERSGAFHSHDPRNLPTRKGAGPVGLFLLAALLLAIVRPRSRDDRETDRSCERRLLGFYCVLGFVLLHAVVRWSDIGRFRLAHGILLPGLGLLPIVLRGARARTAVLMLSVLSLTVMGMYSAGVTVMKRGLPLLSGASGVAAVLDRRALVYRKISADGSETEFRARVDYTNEEVLRDIVDREIGRTATVGWVSHFNSEDFFLFGRRGDNRVVPIVAHDPQWREKLLETDFVVVDAGDEDWYNDVRTLLTPVVTYERPDTGRRIELMRAMPTP